MIFIIHILYKYYIKNFLKNQLINTYIFWNSITRCLISLLPLQHTTVPYRTGIRTQTKNVSDFFFEFFIAVRILVERPRVELG